MNERGRLAKTGDRFGQIVGREKRQIMGTLRETLREIIGRKFENSV